GLHLHPNNGRLGLHLDYEIHPFTNKERKLNIILYLSKDWKTEYNGHTELWSNEPFECVKKCSISFNRACIFKTNDISWHGLPEKIKCPEHMLRKSLAYYYVSEPTSNASDDKIGNDGSGFRKKATFVPRPNDINKDKL